MIMTINKQISSTQNNLPTPLNPSQMLKVKGGNGEGTPPDPAQEVVIEDLVNG
jgi:hypothetical protein